MQHSPNVGHDAFIQEPNVAEYRSEHTPPLLHPAGKEITALIPRQVLEAVPDAIIIVSDSGEILLANSQAGTMFGYRQHGLVGQTVEQLIPRELRAIHREHRKKFDRSPRARPMNVGLELRALHRDGHEFPVEISLSPLIVENRALTVAAIRDVSERKNAEARFRNLLEAAPDAIIVTNRAGEILLFNAQAHALFGYDHHEMVGNKIEVLVPHRWRAQHALHRAGYHHKPRVRPMRAGLELYGLHKSGREFPVEISLSPLETNDGTLVLSAIRDITRRKELENEISNLNAKLKRRNAELMVLNKELESFSYSVAHDLRAPLRAIDGFSLAILEDCGDELEPRARSYFDRVRSASARMGELIDDLLNLARTARCQMVRAAVDLSALADEVVAQLQSSEANRQVNVVIEPGITVEGDRNLLRVVLENLFSNAWKFTSKCPNPLVEMGVRRDAGHKVFFVRDNGVGFDMKYADKLFGAFQRLHDPRDFPGTGVGLATVQRILHRHGGCIWAESVVGQGTTFCFAVDADEAASLKQTKEK